MASAHPPQVRLPGQAAAPDGPVDVVTMYVIHHAFRRDLTDVASAVARTAVPDRRAWTALATRWDRFATVLHHHHTGEDEALWPLLLERVDASGDAEGRAVLEAMEAEHAVLDPLLEACADGFARMASGGSEADRSALAQRVAAARDALDRHLAHEETDAMALLQRHLTQADWDRVERRFPRPRLADAARSVCWVVAGVPPEVRERTFSVAGGPFRLLWLLGRRRFDREQAELFGGARS